MAIITSARFQIVSNITCMEIYYTVEHVSNIFGHVPVHKLTGETVKLPHCRVQQASVGCSFRDVKPGPFCSLHTCSRLLNIRRGSSICGYFIKHNLTINTESIYTESFCP